MASRTPTVLVRNALTWHTTAAYKQALPTSNTTVTKHSTTSGMIVPPPPPPQQLDLMFMHQRHGPHVTDAGVFQPRNNIISDHHATHLKLHLTRHLSMSKKAQIQSELGELLVEDPINWSLLHKDKLK
jgi:hypothetical protein